MSMESLGEEGGPGERGIGLEGAGGVDEARRGWCWRRWGGMEGGYVGWDM